MSDAKRKQVEDEAVVELSSAEIMDGINWYYPNPFRIQKPDPAYRYYDASNVEGHPQGVAALRQIGYELDPDRENACSAPGHVRMRIPLALKQRRDAMEAHFRRVNTESFMQAPSYAHDGQAGPPEAITFAGHERRTAQVNK